MQNVHLLSQSKSRFLRNWEDLQGGSLGVVNLVVLACVLNFLGEEKCIPHKKILATAMGGTDRFAECTVCSQIKQRIVDLDV